MHCATAAYYSQLTVTSLDRPRHKNWPHHPWTTWHWWSCSGPSRRQRGSRTWRHLLKEFSNRFRKRLDVGEIGGAEQTISLGPTSQWESQWSYPEFPQRRRKIYSLSQKIDLTKLNIENGFESTNFLRNLESRICNLNLIVKVIFTRFNLKTGQQIEFFVRFDVTRKRECTRIKLSKRPSTRIY